jgi:hypothetical protein
MSIKLADGEVEPKAGTELLLEGGGDGVRSSARTVKIRRSADNGCVG